jgi:hypothetical protein
LELHELQLLLRRLLLLLHRVLPLWSATWRITTPPTAGAHKNNWRLCLLLLLLLLLLLRR